jgi:hypothetical protein
MRFLATQRASVLPCTTECLRLRYGGTGRDVEASRAPLRNVASAVGTLAGLTRTAMRTASGTKSCKSPSRLATTSEAKNIDARRVAAWPGEACNKIELHRVFADAEHDRDRRSRSFSRKRSKVAGKFHWLAGPRPADHGGLTELGL